MVGNGFSPAFIGGLKKDYLSAWTDNG